MTTKKPPLPDSVMVPVDRFREIAREFGLTEEEIQARLKQAAEQDKDL